MWALAEALPSAAHRSLDLQRAGGPYKPAVGLCGFVDVASGLLDTWRLFARHSRGASRVAFSPVSSVRVLLMASTTLKIAATRPTPFRTGASEVQFVRCARFSGHRFRPTALGTWASLFFVERRAIHRIFHDRNIFTRRLVRCKHRWCWEVARR